MPKVPESAKKEIPRKCPLCGQKYKSKEYLVGHIDKHHKDEIPEGWTASRYENYLRTGKESGHCVICGDPTDWNETTWKYNRLCIKSKCRKAISDSADKNMIGKYGKTTLLNDANHQRKMIYSKKNSGVYYFDEDVDHRCKMLYASSEEKKFLEMLDVFLEIDPADVMSPSPNNYAYEYEGKTHMYIPDVYIISLNLEVEIKEPLDNQNKHPKIQAVDKIKEKLKDEMMDSIDYVNYIKVNGSDYAKFFQLFYALRNKDTLYKQPSNKHVKAMIESLNSNGMEDFDMDELMSEILEEPVFESGKLDELNDMSIRLYTDLEDTILANTNYKKYDSLSDINRPKPFGNFKQLVESFDKEVKNCTSIKDMKLIRSNMFNFKKYLKSVLNNKSRSEYHYEAKKALIRLEDIIDASDIKLKKLVKAGGVSVSHVEESIIVESNISGTKNNKRYRPVYVMLSYTNGTMAKVIKGFTRGTFSHASISLDTSMKHMCSFNANGFVDEDFTADAFNVADKGYYSVYMYMATQEEYDIIKGIINEFTDKRNQLKYSIAGLINYVLGRETTFDNQWFCSEFVSYVLNQANPHLLKSHYSLYSPDDLSKTRKMKKIASGKTSEYNHHKIDNIIKTTMIRRGFTDVSIELGEIASTI